MQLWLIILNLTTSALVIGGLLLVVIALAGTRVGIGIRCRRCRHEFPRGGVIPPICSDCGADLSPERALILGRYRPRTRMLAIGVVLLLAAPIGVAVFVSFVGSGGLASAPARAAAAPDELIDAAAAGDRMAKSELGNRLRGYDSQLRNLSADYRSAWSVATERMRSDAATRAVIIKAVTEAARWTDNFPAQGVVIDDATLLAFGEALAHALETDPAFAAAIPDGQGRKPFGLAMAEPVLASPKAVRAFLRGPELALRRLERPSPSAPPAAGQDGPARFIEPQLAFDGFSSFGRSLAFGALSISYVRNDGSTVEIGLPPASAMPVLEPDWGTRISIGAAIDDPEWSGEIRVSATVGTVANMNVARAAVGAFPLVADPFEYEWRIQVERVTPEAIRAVAVCDPTVTESIEKSLRAATIQVHGGGAEPTAVVELEHPVSNNGIFIRLEIEVVQDGRSWKEPRPPTHLYGQRTPFPVIGFDPLAPFQLIARGIRPAISESVLADHAFAAGTWTASFDKAARPPSSVKFKPLDDAPESAPPDAVGNGRDMGRVIRD